MTQRPLVIWQLSDGKRGHERQVEGLIAAFVRAQPVQQHRFAISGASAGHLLNALLARFPAGHAMAKPDLIIGAGRACQWPLIAARRAWGGRSIYLMRPALPHHWFDLCIIPRHDGVAPSARVLVSEGPLNPMRPAPHKSADRGLIALGGPSRHYAWDSAAILQQVRSIVRARRALQWSITDSRRTPPACRDALRHDRELSALYQACDDLPENWLMQTLAAASQAWISADSVSMIYEALSAGATVGLIAVPARRDDRITAIAGELRARGWLGTLEAPPGAPPGVLDEAGRCVALLRERWPELGHSA